MKKLNLLLTIIFILSLTAIGQAQKTYWFSAPNGINIVVPNDVAAVILHNTKAPGGGENTIPRYRTFTKNGVVYHENEIAWETPKLDDGGLTWVTEAGVGEEWKECNTSSPQWKSFIRALKEIAKPYDEKGEWSYAKVVIFEGGNAGQTAQANVETNAAPKPTPQPVKPVQTQSAVAQTGGGNSNCSNVKTPLTNAEIAEILRVHNEVRAAVGTLPLKWNCALAGFAQDWANKDVFEHRTGDDLQTVIPGIWAGENLSTDANPTTSVADMIQGWIDEKKDFNGGSKTCAPGKICGHYMQMVWRTTTEIGCGINRKSSTMGDEWKGQATYLVCNYSPGGNDGSAPY